MMPYDNEEISEEGKYTNFGLWFNWTCKYFDTTMYMVSKRAGFSGGTLSKATRYYSEASISSRGISPRRANLIIIVDVLREIAEEKQKPWSTTIERTLYHSAGYCTPEELADTKEHFLLMETDQQQQNKERP